MRPRGERSWFWGAQTAERAPTDAVEWQRMRNYSGMHSFETEDVILDEPELARYLLQRLYGERV